MAELERRQDLLLKKLDILYDRIKTISSLCATSTVKPLDKVVTAKLVSLYAQFNPHSETQINILTSEKPFFLLLFSAKQPRA